MEPMFPYLDMLGRHAWWVFKVVGGSILAIYLINRMIRRE